MSDPRPNNPTAAVILIGNELLSGKVTDENGQYLIKELRALGVTLQELRIIQDSVDAIAAAVSELAGRHDYLFTTGGVGPTHDDITLEGVARAFAVNLVENAAMAHHISAVFASDAERRAAFLKMAQVPEGTTLVQSSDLMWPVYRVANVFILPGVPEIFRRQFEAIRGYFLSEPFFLRTVYFRIDEGELAPVVTEACGRFPGVSFGSYPVLNNPDYRVQVTIESKARDVIEAAYRWLVSKYRGDAIFKVVDGGS